jgi:P-type Cu2+ transporter
MTAPSHTHVDHGDAHHEHAHHHQDHHAHGGHAGHGDHVAMFRHRFWWCLLLTLPIVATSEMVMDWFGYEIDFRGIALVGPVLGTIVFVYGGRPFLEGGWSEIRAR